MLTLLRKSVHYKAKVMKNIVFKTFKKMFGKKENAGV